MATKTPVPINATPAVGQLVEHDGKVFETIREGQAYILIPPNTRTSVDPQAKAKAGDNGPQAQNVFYNPIQQFNRDLSVLAIKVFGEDLCEKRRLKHERDSSKQQAKKGRKRKRREDQAGDEVGEDAEAKLRKTDEGVPVSADGPMVSGQSQSHAVGDALEQPEQAAFLDVTTDNAPAQPAGVEHGNTTDRDGEALPPLANGQEDQLESKGEAPQQSWQPKFRILDALSATGLRALRYASEIPFATSITANDMDRNATKSIKVNVEHNKLSGMITPNTANAMAHMYSVAFPPEKSHGPNHVNARYDVIDLDPYGTAAPFIDSALQSLNDGGLLCVTCTDSGVFASCGYSEKTYSLYGGMPIKGSHSHEGGLRIILHSIASTAAKYGLAIEPVLSLSIDFYVRMFVRVIKSPADVKFLAGKTMLVYGCDAGCGAWHTQPLGRNTRQTGKGSNPQFTFKHSIAQAPSSDRHCEHCGTVMHVAGPMWAGPIHNAAFVGDLLSEVERVDKDIYQTKLRLEGMLDTALNELSVIDNGDEVWRVEAQKDESTRQMILKTPPEALDLHPFFFIPSALAKVIHCQAPPEAAVKGALRRAGYRATRSHCKPGSVKTDAPWTVIWEIMREWARQKSPIKEGALKEGVPGWRIMQAARKPEEDEPADENDSKKDDGTPEIVTEANGKSEVRKERPMDPKRIRVVFDEVLGKDKAGKRLVRYQVNPRENWGPMSRAKGSG